MNGLHWITVGQISEKAIDAIKDNGGKIVHVKGKGDIPEIFMIGIPCRFFSHSTDDVEIRGWNEMFIKVPSHGLSLSLSSQLHQKNLHINQVPVDKTGLSLVNEKLFS